MQPLDSGVVAMRSLRFVFSAGWLCVLASAALAAPPEVSYVHPDYPTAGPRVITGEGFTAPGDTLELLCWRPPEGKEEAEAGLQAWAQGKPPALPDRPPPEATHAQLFDCESQVAVAATNGVALWARNKQGVSRAYAFDLAMPWWLLEDEVHPGDIVALGGRALRALYRQDAAALIAGGKATRLTPIQPRRDYRTMDDNLLFLPLPPDLPPGRYQVVVHNGNGGRYGWRSGGWLTVRAKLATGDAAGGAARARGPRWDVRDFGARGDDEAPDTEAIAKALETAGKARGVVFFPPGRWRTEQTLVVPEGVTLCGAGRDLSVIEGVGERPKPDAQTTALVHPGSGVCLERLTLEGVVYRGPAAYWEGLVVGAPVPGGLHHVTIRECRLIGQEARASSRRGFWPQVPHARGAYLMTLALAEGHHHRVLDNDIVGPIGGGSVFDPLRRNEWTGNVIHGGGSADMVSLSLLVEESLVDSHRDVFSGGLDVWGGENTSPKDVEHQPGKPNYYPSFYNHFARCWLDGSPTWFFCDVGNEATPRGPMLFGNRMTECMSNRAHAARTGFAMQHAYSGAVSVGGHVPQSPPSPPARRVGLSHTIVAANSLSWTPVGVAVGPFARKTVIVGNTFEGVNEPMLDWGMRTLFQGNSRQTLDKQGRRREPLSDVRGRGM